MQRRVLCVLCVVGLAFTACSSTDSSGIGDPCVGSCGAGLACVDGLCEASADASGGQDAPDGSDPNNLAPTAIITYPSDGDLVQHGDPVTLTGSAADDRDAPDTLTAR